MRPSRGPNFGILRLNVRFKVKIRHSLRHWRGPNFAFYALKSIFLVINPRRMPVRVDKSHHNFNRRQLTARVDPIPQNLNSLTHHPTPARFRDIFLDYTLLDDLMSSLVI